MKFSIRDSRLVSVGVASVIAVGVIGFGSAAFAQDSGTTPTPSTQSDGATPEAGRGLGRGLAIRHILKEAGLTAQEIADGKAAGLTWGQILDQYGSISAAEAKQQALDALKTKLDEAVANGRITQEQADQRLADASTKIDEFLNSVPGDHLPGGPGLRGLGGPALETIAGVLGMDVETLRSELASGKTVAEIAGDKTQAVIDALVAEANAKVDEALANGRITEEQAATMKTRIAEAITKFVNEGGPLKGLGKGFGKGPGRMWNGEGAFRGTGSTAPTQ
jgi:ribosomal protein S20